MLWGYHRHCYLSNLNLLFSIHFGLFINCYWLTIRYLTFFLGLICLFGYRTYLDECVPILQLERNCYEEFAMLHMNIRYQLSNNKTGYHYCGRILNCNTSPCIHNLYIGEIHYCDKDNANPSATFQIFRWRVENFMSFALFFCGITLIITSILMAIHY